LIPKIIYLTNDPQDYISEQAKIILNTLQQLETTNFPIRNVSEIIIADDYSKTFSSMHANGGTEIQKRGYYSAAKNFVIKDGGSTKILFNRKYTDFRYPDSIKSLIGQIADLHLPEIIPTEIEKLPVTIEFNLNHDLKSVLREFACKAIGFYYLSKITFTLNEVEYRVCDKNDTLLEKIEAALNRDIKRLHFRYQMNDDIGEFWISILQNLSFYCNQAIYASHKDSKNCHLKRIFDSMVSSFTAIVDNNENYIMEVKQTVCEYLEDHNLRINEHADGKFELRIAQNPKDFYKDNKIVDTEDRIVCFADILGFSNIVEEYDMKPNSTLLQDLKETLDIAYSLSLKKFAQNSQLDYRVFSDCLCISTPFFDDEDFFTQLFVITQSIKVFQTQLMLKGFFIRGAIAFGSHYEDENMIFSNALIEAFLIESNKKEDNKAIYSRIALSKAIVDKIFSQRSDLINRFPWNDSFVKDNSDNVVFLNSFDMLKNVNSNFDYMKSVFDNACEGMEDDPLINVLRNATNIVLNATINLFTPHLDNDVMFKPFLDIIESKIIENKNNEKYRKKYEWLKEFIIWYMKNQGDNKFTFILKKDDLQND